MELRAETTAVTEAATEGEVATEAAATADAAVGKVATEAAAMAEATGWSKHLLLLCIQCYSNFARPESSHMHLHNCGHLHSNPPAHSPPTVSAVGT